MHNMCMLYMHMLYITVHVHAHVLALKFDMKKRLSQSTKLHVIVNPKANSMCTTAHTPNCLGAADEAWY